MGKWKHKDVEIKAVYKGNSYHDHFALGDDDNLYRWSWENGAWEKYWHEQDKP